MKTVGIVAEYNPFHNGHKYHLETAMQVSGADYSYVVMSGDFVQRGEPAIMPKYLRTQMALLNGASVVVELPVSYATASAEYFAEGAVALLDAMGCDSICFGSECGDVEPLWHIAKLFHEEPTSYRDILQKQLKLGKSFPLARAIAVSTYLQKESYNEVLQNPNNILGIEYLKALLKTKSQMTAYTIRRIDKGYHSQEFTNNLCSAFALRTQIYEKKEAALSTLREFVPSNCISLLEHEYARQYPVFLDDLSAQLRYKLIYTKPAELSSYLDVHESLANRICSSLHRAGSYSAYIEELKTKELTYTRISRALLHIVLDMKQEDARQELAYLRILGFRKQDETVLRHIKKTSNLPMITRFMDYNMLPDSVYPMAEQNLRASALYQGLLQEKYGKPMENEFKRQVLKV